MSMYVTLWVSFGLLPAFLLAVGAVECSEKETLLQPITGRATQLTTTDCLMECTGMMYIKKLQLQDKRNIRLKDSTEGKEPLGNTFIFRMLQDHMCLQLGVL